MFRVSSSDGVGISNVSGSVDSSEEWGDRAELVLVLLSNLYLLFDLILVNVSGPSFCSTCHHLLTTILLTTVLIRFDKLLSLKRECLL